MRLRQRRNRAQEVLGRLPLVVRTEGALKLVAMAALLTGFVLVSRLHRGHPSPGAYMLIGFLLLALAAWQTIGRLTRHGALAGAVFWAAFFGLAGGYLSLTGSMVEGAALVAAALVVLLVARVFRAWKRRMLSRAGGP